MAALQFTDGTSAPIPVGLRKQLLPNLIDGLATVRPNATWAKVPRDPTSWEHGVHKIRYQHLANAVNGLSSWLLKTLGNPKRPFESVAYFGLWDPRYHIFTVAATKAGYKAVLPSGAGGPEAILAFLKQVECETILVANRDAPLIRELAKETSVRLHTVPPLWDLIENQVVHVPYTKTFDAARSDPLLVLHTSGSSTGKPKPIIYTHDWAATYLLQMYALPPAGFRNLEIPLVSLDIFVFTPQAFGGGFFANLLASIYGQMTTLYPLPTAMLTRDALFDALKHNPVDLGMIPSFLLEQIAQNTADVSFLAKHAPKIAFAGAPLAQRSGDILSRNLEIFSMYGTSESGTVPKISPSSEYVPETWNHILPHPAAGFDMGMLPGTDNSYEAVLVRNQDPELEQPIFKMFPELTEWSTRDVFSARTFSLAGSEVKLYKYTHRVDDTVTLVVADPLRQTALQTLFPLQFEQEISNAGLIRNAIVIGERKPRPGLLVELNNPQEAYTSATYDQIVAQIHPSMHLLDSDVARQYIILLPIGKTLPRANKGSVKRGAALKLFQEDIEQIYLGADSRRSET